MDLKICFYAVMMPVDVRCERLIVPKDAVYMLNCIYDVLAVFKKYSSVF